jgi:undecaprenyl diphosphate synthase
MPSTHLKQDILKKPLPSHIAVIMDGNGRWAKKKNKPRLLGHRLGAQSVRQIIEAAVEINLRCLTLYAFSEENWKRPQREIQGIFSLLHSYLLSERKNLARHNIRLQTIGRIEALPQKLQDRIRETKEFLGSNTGLTLVLALSYGGRQEILEATKKLAHMVQDGTLDPESINPQVFSQALFTGSLPDPDLLIRTSGEQRLSNFLLWQMAYGELWFTDKCWPDFGKADFYQAIQDFQERGRRFGGV